MSTLTGVIGAIKKTITKFTTETRGHADDFNAVHQDLINNDVYLDDKVTKMELDLEKAPKFDKEQVTIKHNLNYYPLVRVMMVNGYGHTGFGVYEEGSKIQIPSNIEYLDSNSLRLHLDEDFEGSATITFLEEKNYLVQFTGEDTYLEVKLID